MSKRAEDAALTVYPKSDFNGVETRRKRQRKCYIQGYEQAEKDTIERALDWLKYAQKNKMSFDAAIAYFKAIMEEE